MKFIPLLVFISTIYWLSACSSDEKNDLVQAPVPWVKTVQVQMDNQSVLMLSGTVRARFEIPISFQLNGRIASRHIDAGQTVVQDQTLFKLDARDLTQSIHAAKAEQMAAQAALATATADVARDRKLVQESFISEQALERTELVEQEARTRLNAAHAQLQQSRNASGYANLRAEHPGVLIEVTGEPGQKVVFGQTIAILAREGELEIEVFFPEGVKPRQTGHVQLTSGQSYALELREAAGAADLASRTWRARYRVLADQPALSLGEVVRSRFIKDEGAINTFKVPLGALDERGKELRIWQLQDNQAQPVAAQIISLDTEYAWVTAADNLIQSNPIIALGTNRLKPGMLVQALK